MYVITEKRVIIFIAKFLLLFRCFVVEREQIYCENKVINALTSTRFILEKYLKKFQVTALNCQAFPSRNSRLEFPQNSRSVSE